MRNCGSCTLCCYLFEIPYLNKASNTECQYCEKGCSIYEERPECCLGFNCAWLQVENANEQLRPDNCKMVFEKINDRLFHGARDTRYPITEAAKGQVMAFVSQGFSVAIRDEYSTKITLAEGHTMEEICADLNSHLEKRRGCSIVHN